MAKRKKGGKTKDVETLIFTDLSTNWSDSSTSNEIERTQVVPRIACEVDELAARIPTCSVCDSALLNNGKAFTECIGCQAQSHLKCVGLTNKQLKILSDEGKQWNCRMCTVRMENSKRAADASIIISDLRHLRVSGESRGGGSGGPGGPWPLHFSDRGGQTIKWPPPHYLCSKT